MLAEIGPFQALLDAIGWLLASLYDLTGNFGFAIIILTIIFRVVLLPLGIKQIKSMQAMQALQPKIKEIQKKYKGNKQKIQEQTMKLYQEYGVNPLGGCLPLLLQFPILIAMYAVIRAPIPYAETDPAKPAGVECVEGADSALPPACFKGNHLPDDSQLFVDITTQDDDHMHFLLMNLQCSPAQSGKTVPVLNTQRKPSGATLDCGDSLPDRIPYFVMLALMIGTTFYSSRQTQKASPASAQGQQQQIITKVMPLMFGVFGFAFPAGLVLYWTVSNAFQIGQQVVMLRLGHIGPQAMERRLEQTKSKSSEKGDKPRAGLMGRMMERADQERKRRVGEPEPLRKPPPRKPASGQGNSKGGSGRSGTGGTGKSSGSGGSGKRPKGGSAGPKRSGPNRPKGSGR